jgi:hypothetical protein
MTNKKRWKIVKLAWLGFAVIFMVWNWTTFQSRGLPDDTFTSSDSVEISQTEKEILFRAKNPSTEEIIFFQGGLVDPNAYAPLCKKIASAGYTCHLIKMPFRLPQKGYKIINEMFDLKSGRYILGGHSQGGKMAAQFVYENPGIIKGLFLLATSHPRDIDLSGLSIPALKLYGSNDGLASPEEVLENQDKLPANAASILIQGANHSQFGYMGKLLMDDKATISLEEQQLQTVRHLLTFFHELENEN